MLIEFSSVEKIIEFINLITKVEDDVYLVSARYIINAKSIMGIFSLDFSKPIEVLIQGEVKNAETIEILKHFAIQKSQAA